MEVQIVASSPETGIDKQYSSCYLINGTVAIDAGPLGFWETPEKQSGVRHVFLTHSHADHIATLPIFVENAYDPSTPAVTVHASAATLEVLRKSVFNDTVWPDFIRLSPPNRPFLVLKEVMAEQAIEVEGLRLLPVEVNHVVPTFGYIVTDGRSTVVFGADSGPTDRIWEVLRGTQQPRSVFLEASFPNAMTQLAVISAHMTPEMFGGEYRKMPPVEKVIAIHVKRRFRTAIEAELRELGIPGLELGESGKTYSL